MSITPPSAVGSLAAAAPASRGPAPDGDLAGVFAALVESLQAQLTDGEAVAESATDGEETSESSDIDAEALDGGADDEAFAVLAGAVSVPGSLAPGPVLTARDGEALSAVTIGPIPAAGAEPGVVLDEAALPTDVSPDQAGQIDTVDSAPVDADVPGQVVADGAAAAEPSTAPADDGASTDTLEAGVDEPTEAPGADHAPDVEPLADVEVPSMVPADPSPAAEGTANVGSALRLTAAAPASARTEVAATAAPPPAPALPDQLVEIIAPLRRGVDGSHQVSLQLRPDELGEVLVEMHVRGNEISISLRADLPGTSDLLRQSLNELRAQLEAAGFRSGALDVGSHPDPRSAHDRAAQRSGTPPEGTAVPGPPGQPPIPTGAVPTAGLDLRI